MLRSPIRALALSILLPVLAALPAMADSIDETPAKILFGDVTTPSPLAPRAIGSYAKGCLAGAVALPVNGPDWQAMRLSRNRNWGTPELIAFTEKLAHDAKRQDGWPGLLVGDMGQPRGGPARTGHASHQIGLDVDIWLTRMPNRLLSRDEREKLAATSMVNEKERVIDRSVWSAGQHKLIRRAALDPRVARIFVNPAIKKALCEEARGDRGWLNKVRPWWGHTYHFHVRLDCPAGMASCIPQKAPPPGDGCGPELDAWLQPPKPPKTPPKPTKPTVKPRPMLLADLPPACRQVLTGAPAAPEAEPAAAMSYDGAPPADVENPSDEPVTGTLH
ncbi:MAG: penicillin-insensitive murein endopeptidase [Candidatus Kaistia colombiensis]|nr:MAG: penicillin-insensitive murein endopeptidase [Kaistia sp.]